MQRGGRPLKRVHKGRPAAISTTYCTKHVEQLVSDQSSQPPYLVCHSDHHQVLDLSILKCTICCDLLNTPVELVTCGSNVCAGCLCAKLKQNDSLVCSTTHLTDYSTIREASTLIQTMLGSVCVLCKKCHGHMRLKNLSEHAANSCSTHLLPVSPVSVEQVLEQPATAPLTPLEEKLQTSLVKRSLSTSPDNRVVQLKTRGQVIKNNNLHTKCHYN